jgi:uncharacterized glyoxalase superfamily protein PhnB
LSKDFYRALGFDMPWASDDLAYFRGGDTSFLLQRFFVEEHAKNFQMHMLVENVDDWYSHVTDQGVADRFGAQIGHPQNQPWGMRDFTLVDPTGILWRIAQNIPAATGE